MKSVLVAFVFCFFCAQEIGLIATENVNPISSLRKAIATSHAVDHRGDHLENPSSHGQRRILLGRPDGLLVSNNDVIESIRRDREHLVNELPAQSKKVRLPRADSVTDDSGVTTAQDAAGPMDKEHKDIWETHRPLFIAVLIFIGISIVLTIICCICLSCRKRLAARHKPQEPIKEEPTVVVSPGGGLMQEQTSPNDPVPVDEENGWIIPLDQMTKEELEQPEVQVSRL